MYLTKRACGNDVDHLAAMYIIMQLCISRRDGTGLRGRGEAMVDAAWTTAGDGRSMADKEACMRGRNRLFNVNVYEYLMVW